MKLLSLVLNLFRPLLCKGGHDAIPEYIGISVIGFRCYKCQYKWHEARNARWNGNPWGRINPDDKKHQNMNGKEH